MNITFKNVLKVALFVAFVAVCIMFIAYLQVHAAIPNTSTPPTPPSSKRVVMIVIHNGEWVYNDYEITNAIIDYSGDTPRVITPAVMGKRLEVISQPSVEIFAVGCEPYLDAQGHPVLNEFGQPVYKDNINYQGYKRITDPAELMPFLATVWTPMMTAADAKLATIDVVAR